MHFVPLMYVMVFIHYGSTNTLLFQYAVEMSVFGKTQQKEIGIIQR